MASDPEPEVQFAQRLASNEKPVRTRAMKKLRKYLNVRSQRGGFTGDELLKLWKGLFYCLWMQDKPLLQEELSKQISSLIHSFQDVDGQFLYMESFLQTFKREWTGIDRLRMDKFFQLVRFMFRQTFEMLKRKKWESSVVGRFLELLTVQVLQSGSGAPSGLQFHILDLYMTELATVGSAELTADQNLIFIEPFCKTAAKTKDRGLFRTICSSIFSAIIDQAPFAIDELMKEVKAASDSDSGQASEGDDGEEQQTASKPVGKKKTGRPINGKKSTEEEEDEEEDEDYDDDDDDDELLHLEDSDSEAPCDEDIGPVLQFDYSALANKLFELASRSSTPSQNRQRLYKIIKVLRDLSEGIFPQDEYPEEVSTDEDDDMFGSRKRMKRRKPRMEEEDEGDAPASKKRKKKEASTPNKQNKDSAQDDAEPADLTTNPENKKKKRKKRKKKKKAAGEGNAEKSEQEQIVDQSLVKEAEAETQSSVSSVKVTEDAVPEGRSEAASVTVSEETSELTSCAADGGEDQTKINTKEEPAEKKQTKKKKNKGLKANSQTEESQVSATPDTDATTAAEKTKKGLKNLEEVEVNGVSAEEDATAEPEKPVDCTTPGKKKSKKKKAEKAATVEVKHAEITSVGEEDVTAAPLEKKTKKKCKQEVATLEASSAATPLKNKRRKNQKESEEDGVAVAGTPQVDAEELPITMTTPAKKKKKKPSEAQVEEINDQTVGCEDKTDSSSGKTAKKKKKRKIPVTFEFEADELEAAAAVNGVAEEKVTTVKKKKVLRDAGEPSTPLSSKKSQRKAKTPAGSAFITFQSGAAVPTPLFCKTKGGCCTPPSRKKKTQTPKSESKKVTFGLKNNKTAEFRKTDRSLLVSPDGSSRVPFDPQQKPKFGVLKSPGTPLSSKLKKTANGTRKTGPGAPKSTPKRRPTAADFF
ncbi:ribosomal RNA processing protein 1 homolog B isoform X2 [Dicentrarchus labrax]|uniref:ribosomal RNA processing protein 1 homolog B isoform X2 n=1 Tax=Dicentrarchus labrax TaxID=13489 RepID=UPI0021F59E04|nr:ribosomal RNA processing protein 1 homolog B isoform X2 [Dicentrarchus labrax]